MSDEATDRPPGPNGLPIVGSTYRLFREPLAFAERCAREYGDVVSLRVAGMDAVQVSHPDHVEYVLADNFDNYRKGEFYRSELDLLGEGLLTSEGDLWRRQRSLIGPIFHPSRTEQYAGVMVEFAERAADAWEPGEPVNLSRAMQRLTLEVVANALFNVDIREEAPGISESVSTVMEVAIRSRRLPFSLPDWIPTPGKIRYDRAVETFDGVVADIIRDHRERDDPPDDVVSKLLAARDDEGEGMSDRQIRDEVLTLLLAGHDTTALALGYVWYLLGANPDAQARVADEVDRVVGDRSPTVDDLADLDYTGRVIKEALRLYPPAFFFTREPIEDDEIGGYAVPAGTLVMFNQWLVHRDPRFFDEPDAFVPDRWTGGFEDALHPYAYFPFSGGPRRCIGERFATMEMQFVIAAVLKRYRIELATDPPLELDPMVSLRPASPVRAVPHPR